MQLGIVFSGNFNFFNLLAMLINLCNFDDNFIRTVTPKYLLNTIFELDPIYNEAQEYITLIEKIKLNNLNKELQKENKDSNDKVYIDKDTNTNNIQSELNNRANKYELEELHGYIEYGSFYNECIIFFNFFCVNILFTFFAIFPMKELLSYNINLRGLQHFIHFLKNPIFLSIICMSFVFYIIGRFVIFSLIAPGDIIIKREDSTTSKMKKVSMFDMFLSHLGKFLFSTFLILYFLSANFSFYTSIGIKFDEFKPLEQGVKLSQFLLNRFHITSVYGMYKKIEGKTGRNELEVLIHDPHLKWQNLDFKYKISNDISMPLKRVSPHQPRIDWEMSKAAYAKDFNTEAWLIILVGKVLEKNPVILDLLGYYISDKAFYYQGN